MRRRLLQPKAPPPVPVPLLHQQQAAVMPELLSVWEVPRGWRVREAALGAGLGRQDGDAAGGAQGAQLLNQCGQVLERRQASRLRRVAGRRQAQPVAVAGGGACWQRTRGVRGQGACVQRGWAVAGDGRQQGPPQALGGGRGGAPDGQVQASQGAAGRGGGGPPHVVRLCRRVLQRHVKGVDGDVRALIRRVPALLRRGARAGEVGQPEEQGGAQRVGH
mmetsp:Transcript_39693/g.77684  ORF Transcript_39693/g.77684 Transcript_39693/m.77684 type:complete len:219 (+) Transcript_39693:389-1045(+)